ncbi:MAG: metal-dependent hydrolase [archaeon]
MIVQAHMAYPFLLLFGLDKALGLGLDHTHYLIILFFSILPDLDYVFYFLAKRGRIKPIPQHHEWFTHWPITYSPLLLALVLSPSLKLAIAVMGIYMHMMMDMFNSGDGLMVFYPVSKKYFNFLSDKTRGHSDFQWLAAYKTTKQYRVDMFSFALAAFLFVFQVLL